MSSSFNDDDDGNNNNNNFLINVCRKNHQVNYRHRYLPKKFTDTT